MRNDVIEAYEEIFNIVPETCSIVGVKKLYTTHDYRTNENHHKFLALIEAPVDLDDTLPSRNDCVKIRAYAKSHMPELGGGDIIKKRVVKKDGEKYYYIFTISLTPENILWFGIKGGIMRIEANCYGTYM